MLSIPPISAELALRKNRLLGFDREEEPDTVGGLHCPSDQIGALTTARETRTRK